MTSIYIFVFFAGLILGASIVRFIYESLLDLICDGLVNGFNCGELWNKKMTEAKVRKYRDDLATADSPCARKVREVIESK